MTTPQTRDRLVVLLTEPLAAMGLDVEEVDLSTAGKRRLLRVAVDKDGGVTMDDIAEATREVGRLLDASDVMAERAYTLEVSSPGVERPLTLPRHWRRNTGRLVEVSLDERDGERDTVTGRVIDTDDRAARLDVGGSVREVRFSDVRRARVQIEFKPADRATGS